MERSSSRAACRAACRALTADGEEVEEEADDEGGAASAAEAAASSSAARSQLVAWYEGTGRTLPASAWRGAAAVVVVLLPAGCCSLLVVVAERGARRARHDKIRCLAVAGVGRPVRPVGVTRGKHHYGSDRALLAHRMRNPMFCAVDNHGWAPPPCVCRPGGWQNQRLPTRHQRLHALPPAHLDLAKAGAIPGPMAPAKSIMEAPSTRTPQTWRLFSDLVSRSWPSPVGCCWLPGPWARTGTCLRRLWSLDVPKLVLNR